MVGYRSPFPGFLLDILEHDILDVHLENLHILRISCEIEIVSPVEKEGNRSHSVHFILLHRLIAYHYRLQSPVFRHYPDASEYLELRPCHFRKDFHKVMTAQFQIDKRVLEREHGQYVVEKNVSLRHVYPEATEIGDAYIDILTFSLYVTTFITPIRKLSAFVEQFMQGMAGFKRFVELMRLEPEITDAHDAKSVDHVTGDIQVDDVTFRYERDGEDVLSHVSLHVKPGETVAVVGPSGGGKSTLCQLIPRFYDVTDGAIRIDGRDVRDLKQHDLRAHIGIVQQDVFLFAGTIYDNIAYGRPDATAEEVAEAAKKAEIYDDIMEMPDGFQTYVGERGVMLSGGQKQRVSIARIFLKNPPILILDEATSALDSVTEHKIQSAFDELAKGRTTLIIAHRLSTIRSAGRIIVIDDNHIAEEGTHQELMDKNGEYASLWRAQQSVSS